MTPGMPVWITVTSPGAQGRCSSSQPRWSSLAQAGWATAPPRRPHKCHQPPMRTASMFAAARARLASAGAVLHTPQVFCYRLYAGDICAGASPRQRRLRVEPRARVHTADLGARVLRVFGDEGGPRLSAKVRGRAQHLASDVARRTARGAPACIPQRSRSFAPGAAAFCSQV